MKAGKKGSKAGALRKSAAAKRSAASNKPAVGAGWAVEDYLAALPPDRRAAVAGLRKLILKNLPKGYAETIGYGMICYGVPLATYPDTYNGQPLCYLALASQKQHLSLYTMSVYGDPVKEGRLREGFEKAGKKLAMGKSCIRFRSLDDLPLPVIAQMVAGTSMKEFIALYEKSRERRKGGASRKTRKNPRKS